MHYNYYYRDNHQHEVDLIFKQAHQLRPIEIKAARTFISDFLKGIQYYQHLVGDVAPNGFLVYAGEHEQRLGSIQVLNYKNAAQIIHQDAGENY